MKEIAHRFEIASLDALFRGGPAKQLAGCIQPVLTIREEIADFRAQLFSVIVQQVTGRHLAIKNSGFFGSQQTVALNKPTPSIRARTRSPRLIRAPLGHPVEIKSPAWSVM